MATGIVAKEETKSILRKMLLELRINNKYLYEFYGDKIVEDDIEEKE